MSFQVNATGQLLYYHYVDEVLADADSITLDIYKPDWTTKLVDGKTPTKSATGTYYYNLASAETPAIKGTYRAVWKPIYGSNKLQDEEWFDVGNLNDDVLCFTRDAQEALAFDYDKEADLVQDLINRASSILRKYADLPLIVETFASEKYDGDGTSVLLLDNYPVGSITSLSDTPIGAATNTFVENNDFVVYNQFGKIKLLSNSSVATTFYRDTQNVSVSYTAGQAETIFELPQAIREACSRLVAWTYKRERGEFSNTFGESEENSQGFSAIPRGVKELMQPFRREPIIA